jgi:hypothetical protein
LDTQNKHPKIKEYRANFCFGNVDKYLQFWTQEYIFVIYFYSFNDNGTPAGFYEPATYWEAGKSAQGVGTDWMPLL